MHFTELKSAKIALGTCSIRGSGQCNNNDGGTQSYSEARFNRDNIGRGDGDHARGQVLQLGNQVRSNENKI